jgi:hypothetical protein
VRELRIESRSAVRIHLHNNLVKNCVARRIPRRIAGPASGITARLPPAILWLRQIVMARIALQLGILRPRFASSARGEAKQRLPQLHALARRQFSDVIPSVGIFGLARFTRLFPVPRHHGRKRVKLEIEIRMSGGDHFVVDRFFFTPQMATEAFLAAFC